MNIRATMIDCVQLMVLSLKPIFFTAYTPSFFFSYFKLHGILPLSDSIPEGLYKPLLILT